MAQPVTVKPGTSIHLADFDPGYKGRFDDKDEAQQSTQENIEVIDRLAYRLYGEHRRALLIVLQGMDTSGKDGTIRHVMSGVSPQCCNMTSFKTPTPEELQHDFLWRIHRATPRHGYLEIFNRSHYEDVLVVRVHKLVPKEVWQARYDQINDFEELLTAANTTIVKFFLHISEEEQKKRLRARLADPQKRWKFSLADLEERKLWDDYQKAYEDALTRCNTKDAPWHIVPANHKWYRNWLVSHVLRKTLERMDPQLPPPDPALDGIEID
jgi:PPK2 family polyphosphate:nucleotide phosphotransferase